MSYIYISVSSTPLDTSSILDCANTGELTKPMENPIVLKGSKGRDDGAHLTDFIIQWKGAKHHGYVQLC